ncbi:Leucine rich repeat domain-containing protein [Pseudomonas cannabina]|uniref:RING-type E3 ubiquitin transferase n=1 Tax=Pseudomonas cannabina TaxID=86840 RepID=A0A0P9LT21_PSECA|nr:Leucine rich repeat domain-containing protein [Pseudomonas cannabina]RMN17058.1 Leucine rich repeat domain-containing protein [Pseudomonas cannabina]
MLLVDADGNMLDAWNAGRQMTLSSHVVGPTGNLTQVLGQLLEGLTSDEVTLLTGTGSTDKTARVQGLRRHLADYAELHVERLLDGVQALENRSSDPLVEPLQRDFGRLPDSVALELVSMASDADKTWMTSEKRIPLELAEHAREYQQQLRINRAIEGFYRSSTDNPDTHVAGLGLLRDLPGWRGDISIDLHRDTLEGDEIASLESTRASAVHRILVSTGEGFKRFNHLGDSLGDAAQPFFSALLDTFTDEARINLELPLTADAEQLRILSGRIASARRDRVAEILRMQPARPGLKWPQRLPDGRTGYPMSGRMRGFFRRLGIGASSHSPELAVKSLFPDFSDAEVTGFLIRLRAEHTGAAGQLQDFVRQRLRSLADELRNLQTTLGTWVDETPFSTLRTAREIATRRIHGCWRRLSVHCRNFQGEFLGYALDLDNLRVGEIPEIAASFAHVAVLKARNMQLTQSQTDVLLRNFSNVRSLSLDFNDLHSMPASIAHMTRLTELSLSHNPLQWTEASNTILRNLNRLEILDLNFCALGAGAGISAINSLRLLFLRGTGIERLPQWNWLRSDLIRMDLRDNSISEISLDELDNIDRSLSSSRLHLHLNGNPLNSPTLARIRQFREGRLRPRWGVTQNVQPPAVGPDSTPWLAGLDRERMTVRTRLWQDLRASAGSTDFFQMLSDLTHSADFSNNREELTERVWAMIMSAAASRDLRFQLFDLAAHPQTCGDGLALIFGDMEIHVQVFSIMSSASEAAQPLALFKMSRSLDRLDQLEKIARRDIVRRQEMREPVDEAEVRLAYRIGLQARLELPGQPRTMLFSNMARVTDTDLEAAYTEITTRESSRAFFESLVAREFWMNYLEVRYAPDFEPVKMPFLQRLAALDELPPNQQSDQQYLDQIAQIAKEREQAVNDFAISLSRQISATMNTGP